MVDVCRCAVSVGETCGADEVEAVWTRNITTTVEAECGQISSASKIWNEGLRIRVVTNAALGSVVTYRMDRGSIERAVQAALHAARVSRRDEHWDVLPGPKEYPSLDLWDQSMVDMSSEDLIDPLDEIVQVLSDDIMVTFAGNQVTLKERVCVNSNGIDHEDRGTLSRYGVLAVGTLNEGVTPGFQKVQYLRKGCPDPQRIADSITRDVTLFKHRESASSGRFAVILSPRALQELFYFTLCKALSGENVARKKSFLTGREGEALASPVFTLHDNGIIETGVNSCEMDDEGVPCQDTAVIEEGVLQGFIWNDYWAKRMGCSSTGNANYDEKSNEMLIQPTTMVGSPGVYTREELFDVKDGYYIQDVQGAHGSNPETGDFSVLCSPAYRIRKGELSGGCTGLMAADNIFSLLGNIDAVGCQQEVNEASILPSIRFRNVHLVSR
jgi:PmbA protein